MSEIPRGQITKSNLGGTRSRWRGPSGGDIGPSRLLHPAPSDNAHAAGLVNQPHGYRCEPPPTINAVHQHLQADLEKQLHRVFRARVDLGVTALAAVAGGLRDGQARPPNASNAARTPSSLNGSTTAVTSVMP